MRVPFTIDAHRSPHTQYFANRSFIAKQVGNVRDVGLAGMYQFGKTVPITIEGGIFNGSGLTNQKDFWTKTYNFSAKVTASFFDRFVVVASAQKIKPEDVNIMMWDAGAYYDDTLWHIEAEYLRKIMHTELFRSKCRGCVREQKIPAEKYLTGISALGRYDYMSNHSDGIKTKRGNCMPTTLSVIA